MKMRTLRTGLLFCMVQVAAGLCAQDLGNLKNTEAFRISGGLNLQTGFYGISGAKARQPGFTYLLSSNATMSLYGVSLPFSFTFSNYQRDFRQPFNQFGLSPTYKKLTVHVGYRNISFSQFAMAGYTLAGGGFELKPGRWRLAFLYGRSQKAIKDDTTRTIENSLNGVSAPAYRRMLMSGKIGYGTMDNFVDFVFLRGKDDPSSLPFRPVSSQVLPAKNGVVSLVSQLSFLNKRLIWNGEGAFSVYTRDIGFESAKTGIGWVDGLFKPNISTQTYSAFESQLNYTHAYFGAGLKYRKVTPDYRSMGAYFFQTDFEQLLVNAKLNLMKNKIRLNGSIGNQKDNLQHKKLATTNRRIYNATVSLNPNQKWGVDMVFTNYGTSQRAGRRSLSDTSLINQINSAFTLTPRYTLVKEQVVKNFILIAGTQQLDDRNRFTEQYSQVSNLFLNAIHTHSNIKTNFGFNAGVNYNATSTVVGKTELYGVLGGVSQSWKEGRFSADINGNFNLSNFQSEYNGVTLGFQQNFNWQIHKKHRFYINSGCLFNRSKNKDAGDSFNEYYTKLNYAFTF